jgi:hypothetical protein
VDEELNRGPHLLVELAIDAGPPEHVAPEAHSLCLERTPNRGGNAVPVRGFLPELPAPGRSR